MKGMPASNRFAQSLAELGPALDRLGEALNEGPDDLLLIDGTTRRFEFCFELLWKVLKIALNEIKGFEAASPKQSRQKAYAVGWLDGEKLWIDMLKARNPNSRTCKDELTVGGLTSITRKCVACMIC